MKYLVAGLQTHERVNLLLKPTRINNPNLVQALHDHLVNGHNQNSVAILNEVKPSNFNRALARLEEIAEVIEKVKEIDWAHLNKEKPNE